MMTKKIYIASLTHTAQGIHTTTFPLGAAYIASYAKKVFGKEFEFKVFKFPEDLAKGILKNPPLILGLSNYSWNLELGNKLCSWAKKINPNIIVVFGGPNFPLEQSEKIKFLRQRPGIDFYIQNEGELGFSGLIEKLRGYDFSVKKFKKDRNAVINCAYMAGGQLIEGSVRRIEDINIIPSPYLNGMLESFFDYPLSPLLETTRGCPFTCTYCTDGQILKCRIVRFDRKRIVDELEYISKRVKNMDELFITDLNFGMYEEDIATAKNIAHIQKKRHWPIVIRCSIGKNNPKRLIEIASILKSSYPIGASLQSSDREVLKSIKRDNIAPDDFKQLAEAAKKYGQNIVATDIILGLPGDTKEKHFESLRYAVDNGMRDLYLYQALMLKGSEMATNKSRKTFGLKTRFRVVPGCVGVYPFGDDRIPVAEIEEISVGGSHLTFADYVSCRVMDLFVETFINKLVFEEFYSALETMSIPLFDFLTYFFDHEELFSVRMKGVINSFIESTKNDLYDSYEQGMKRTLFPGIFKKYVSGELGVNEMLIHKAQLTLNFEDVSAVLLGAVKSYLRKRNLLSGNAENYFEQLREFVLCKKGEFYEDAHKIKQTFDYDFEDIAKRNFKIDPRNIKRQNHQFTYKFFHNDFQKKYIKNTLKLYGDSPVGISRLIKRSNLENMYRCFEPLSSRRVCSSGPSREIKVKLQTAEAAVG